MTERLTEHVADWRTPTLSIDAPTRTVRGVALCGTNSRNGYTYPEAVLRAAAALYEGVPVFLDHPRLAGQPAGRSARDLAGTVKAARYEAGRLRGDVTALDTEAGRTFLALAAGDAPRVGMSHVVRAERSGDGLTVERIAEVLSVDAVTDPATTDRLSESDAGGGGREARDQRLEEEGGEAGDAEDSSPVSGLSSLASPHELLAERDELHAEVARLRAELEGVRDADAALADGRLPDWAVTPLFRGTVAAAKSSADRRALVADRAALVERLHAAPPTRRPRTAGPAETPAAVFRRAVG